MTELETMLANLRRLADSTVAMFGKNCEACVHDLTDLDHSLCYIAGDVTHRRPGSPATDLLLKMVRDGRERDQRLSNYRTTTTDGRTLKSSTTLIRDRAGRPVAAFCINFDTTEFYNASQTLLPFAEVLHNGHPPEAETFANNAAETVESLFSHCLEEFGKHPATMQSEEKVRLVAVLEEHGVFQFKGAVEQVATLLGVSKFSIYNYLKKIRSEQAATGEPRASREA